MIAGRDAAGEAPRLHHDPCALVSEDDRLGHRKSLVAHRHVGVTDAGRDEPDQDLVVARLGEIDHFQRHRRGRRAGHRGLNSHDAKSFLDVPAARSAARPHGFVGLSSKVRRQAQPVADRQETNAEAALDLAPEAARQEQREENGDNT